MLGTFPGFAGQTSRTNWWRENLTLTAGDLEGEADMQWEPVSGRDAYLGEWAADPDGPWTQFYVGTKSSGTLWLART